MSTSKSLFAILPTLILTCVLPSSAQHFQQIQGAALAKISAGGASVWGLDAFGQVFRYNPATLTFDQITGARLFQISAGGGNIVQPDEVWGFDRHGQLFRFDPSTQSFTQIPLSGYARVVGVGPGYSQCNPYEVWIGKGSGAVFRYNFCSSTFEQIAGGGGFDYFSIGNSEVWGYSDGHLYRFNFTTDKFDLINYMESVAVGADGVFATDGLGGTAYYLDPGTLSFKRIDSSNVKSLVAGGEGVWAISKSNEVSRLLFSFTSFVQVPGTIARISVGSGTGVWGINTAGQVFVFVTP